jgi:myo-inositol-1(or 4)-monophosphatase
MTPRELAESLALQAGEIMRANFALGMIREWKSDGTAITVTDHTINNLVLEQIQKYFPDHGIIGEEASHDVVGAEYVWVCDPVDGTNAFSHGIPTFTFSLALCFQGVPILGVTLDPMLNRLCVAEKGKGATCNGKLIVVSDQKTFTEGLFAGGGKSFVYDEGKILTTIRKNGSNILNVGSSVYHSMLVAMGETYGTIYMGPFPYDVAAAKILVEEAGGKTSDLQGNSQLYDRKVFGMIASNGIMHDELVRIVNENLIV